MNVQQQDAGNPDAPIPEPDASWDWQEECRTHAADDVALEGGYRLPSYVHDRLFPYQQTGTTANGQ